MNEASARQVLLLQAVEAAAESTVASGTSAPRWSAQDGTWASRAALDSVPADAPADRYIADRARHAMQRLAQREPALAASLERRVWPRGMVFWAALAGGLTGLLADAIGNGQRINLLAPPVWGVVGWNLLVYALLLWSTVHTAGAGRRLRQVQPERGRTTDPVEHERHSKAGPLRRLMQRVLGLAAPAHGAGNAGIGAAFTLAWVQRSAPLTAARVAALLHTAAAALGVGLLAGMYARGLVLEYRAGWESTFLNAGQVHAALSWLMAPAVALSGLALPDVAALEALRLSGRQTTGAGGALWIHLYAITLLLFVIVPRAALALWSACRARGLTQRFPLSLDEPYFQRLLRHRQGGAARVQVLPYAQAPTPASEQGLRALFAQVFGDAAQVHIAPVVAFGAEDDAPGAAPIPPGSTAVAALFDLTATPEAENQGRFVESLLQAAPAAAVAAAAAAGSPSPPAVLMLIDEAAFVKRFGAAGERIVQRREAWRALAATLGAAPVFVNLAVPDLPAAEAALQAALGPAPRALARA
jgi:cytochrome c biogenesis protein CcdA